MLPQRAGRRKWPIGILTLWILASYAFWPLNEIGESCLCGTTRQVLWRLFGHCESRGYIPRGSNPVTDTQRFNGLRENAIDVWTPGEMATLLAGAAQDFLTCLALGGLAGLRTSEIRAMDWQDVRLAERTI